MANIDYKSLRKARQEGFEVGAKLLSRSFNPYERETMEWRRWDRGWCRGYDANPASGVPPTTASRHLDRLPNATTVAAMEEARRMPARLVGRIGA